MRPFLLAAAMMAATPAVADEVTGTILAFDRYHRIIVMTDKTVWRLGEETAAPAEMMAGDVITIEYESAGEDGMIEITTIEVLEE